MTTNRFAPSSTAPAPRFRFGSLESWRAALFVSLGFGAAGADDDRTALPGASELLTAADTCGADAQCPSGSCARTSGGRDGNPQTMCVSPGRPFLVGAEIRRASLRSGGGWCDASMPAADGLGTSQRARLARHYREAALLEHASIAAFARFTLQLLELGAPADLCSAAQQAMHDETSHAQLCFTLASRYAGQPLAPGPLSMSNVLAPATLDDVARLCLLEGCVGETLAALDAAEALAGATDPEVRRALQSIAHDERRHAELGFRFVAWALEQNPGSGLGRALAAVLEATVAASRSARRTSPRTGAASDADDDARLEAHGLLSERRRSALRHAALEEVVVPCVQQLLAEAGWLGVRAGPLAQLDVDSVFGVRHSMR